MKGRSIPPHVFIYITVFLEAIGGGLGRPVLPRLVQEITGRDVAHVGFLYGLLIAVYAVALMLTSKLLGRLSDAYGRRPVILLALVGTAIDYMAAALAPTLWVLMLTRIVAGFCGATLVVCNAYIIDVTAQDQRSVRFGTLRGVMAAGMTLGPVIGGVLGAHGTRTPFWTACVVAALSWLYGVMALPETLKPEDRRPFSWKGALPFYVPKLSGVSIPIGVVATLLLFDLGSSLAQPVTPLYTQLCFGWTPQDLGWFFGIGGILGIVAQTGLPRFVVPKLGDQRTVILGLSVFALTQVLFGFAQASWQFYVALCLVEFGLIGVPALMSLITRYATSAAQGELFGLLVGVSTIASIVGPLAGSWLFDALAMRQGQVFLPGAPYFAGAAVILASLVTARVSGLLDRPEETRKETVAAASI